MKAAARAPVPNGQLEPDPIRLPNGAQQCPLCPDVYTGTYGEHLEQSPRHKIRDQPEDFGRSKRHKKSTPAPQENGEIPHELAAIAERKSLTLEDLPETLRAEHERLRAKERSQANGK